MQSIIVYRNPAEAAFWELASSGQLIPLLASLAVWGAVWGLLQLNLVERYTSPYDKKRNVFTYIAAVVAGVIAITVGKFLWLP